MKNKKVTDIIFYISLLIAWFLSGLEKIIQTETVILFTAFASSCISYFLIKNTRIKIFVIFLITAVAGIYTYEYMILYVPVLLLLVMFDLKDNKHGGQVIETCTTVYIALSIFKIIYTVYLAVKSDMYINGRFTFYIKVAGVLLTFFLLLLITVSRKEKKENKKKTVTVRLIYIFSIVGIFLDAAMLSIRNVHGELQAAQFDFMAWFVLCLCLMYFNDYATEKVINIFNEKTEKFLGFER